MEESSERRGNGAVTGAVGHPDAPSGRNLSLQPPAVLRADSLSL